MKIVKYFHHGVEVFTFEEIKGKHSIYCLCYANCAHFKPGQLDNCEIAEANFKLCLKYHITTPVFECSKYSHLEE